jgi:hypothetical protein
MAAAANIPLCEHSRETLANLCVNFNHPAVNDRNGRGAPRTDSSFTPPSVKYPHKYSAHSTRSATLRNARMSNRGA